MRTDLERRSVRILRISSRESELRFTPLKVTVPAVGSINRINIRAVVDLPQPDSPTRPNVSPGAISKVISETAFTWPTVRLKIPLWIGNLFTKPEVLSKVLMKVSSQNLVQKVDDSVRLYLFHNSLEPVRE